MDSSAKTGRKSMGLNGSDAYVRNKPRKFSEISVEGFDTSLQKYATELMLTKKFSSCGEVLAVSVIKSVGFMRLLGAEAKDKALQLSGTNVGGWIPIVKAAPLQEEPFDLSVWKMKSPSTKVYVKGYDNGLPEIDVKIALCEHFSSCGLVMHITVFRSRSLVLIKGERCEEMALDLNGSVMGGIKLIVELPLPRPANLKSACNYMLSSRKRELEEREKKKIENRRKKEKKKMEIEKKKEKKKKMEIEKKKEKEKEKKKMEIEKKKEKEMEMEK